MKVSLVAIGFSATLAQVVLLRELAATFYGNELVYGVALAAWLAWTAAGAWAMARHGRRAGARTLIGGLALAGLLLPAEICLARGARLILGTTPGALVDFGQMVAAIVVIVAPSCLALGALFTLAARLAVGQGVTPGSAYVWEGAGAVTGGALFSFVFLYRLDPLQTALCSSAVDLGVACYLFAAADRGTKPSVPSGDVQVPVSPYPQPRSGACALALLLCLAALPAGHLLHAATLRWQWPDLVFAGDSPYGRLTVQARAGQRVFYTDGLLAFETQGTAAEESVHFPLLAHPAPARVLLVGGGVAGDLAEVLKHPIVAVTYVEHDPLLIQAARSSLAPQDAAVLSDPRVTLALDDGRAYVQDAARRKAGFDVIVLDVPAPDTGALNRFYTAEFFAEARAALAPGGILGLSLPSAENYWSPELARRNASIYRTLASAFTHVLVLPGERDLYLASAGPLPADPEVLAGRLAARGVRTRWVTADYIRYALTTDRVAAARQTLEGGDGRAAARLNRDLAPICYFYDLALWLSRFYPGLRPLYEATGRASLWWVAAPLLLAAAAARWRSRGSPARRILAAVAALGLAGMLLEVLVLFAFQVLRGYVYAELSLIVTGYMAGLALGGAASNRLLVLRLARTFPRNPQGGSAGVRRGWYTSQLQAGTFRSPCRNTTALTRRAERLSSYGNARDAVAQPGSRTRRTLLAVVAAVAAAGLALPLIFSLPPPVPASIFPALALLAGALGGLAFPLAASLMDGRSGSAAGLLYAADLAGGCLGALLGTAFLIPVLGIPQTCVLVAAVAGAALILLI